MMIGGQGDAVLAVDIGTSSIKGALILDSSRVIKRVRVAFNEISPLRELSLPEDPEERTRAQSLWNPSLWEAAFLRVLERLGTSGTSRIAALSISGNGPSLVPMGNDGAPCAGALLWHDQRQRRLDGEPSFFLPKIAWYREQLPLVWEKAAFFLGCPEYLAYLLGGDAAFYTPTSAFIPHIWTESGAERYRVELSRLPKLIRTGQAAGRVSSTAASRFGLPSGLPIAAGGADFLMALIGSGVVEEGMTCDRAGTSEGINFCSRKKIQHPRVRTLPHAVEQHYNIAGILSSTGLVFEWFRRLTGQKDRSYEKMLEEIRDAAFLPAPLFFPSLHRGAVWEFSGGAFGGLQPFHGPVELGVGVVSAIGFGIRDCLEALEEAGCSAVSMRVCGGQGRNRIWNQMKSDIVSLPLEIPELLDCELTGAAASAFALLSGQGKPSEIGSSLVRIRETVEPDPETGKTWSSFYDSYCETRDRLLSGLGSKALSK